MRILLGAFGDPGHAFPMLALGSRLAQRGHDVCLQTWAKWRAAEARLDAARAAVAQAKADQDLLLAHLAELTSLAPEAGEEGDLALYRGDLEAARLAWEAAAGAPEDRTERRREARSRLAALDAVASASPPPPPVEREAMERDLSRDPYAAAERGYDGPSRNDARARLLAARMLESPPYFDGATLLNPDTMFHTPGWVGNLDKLDSPMDKAFDPKVAEGLTAAWRARAVLGLGPELEARIVAAVDAVARGPFFRYPYVRLNQINWNAELYAYAAQLTGNPELLLDDYRRHVRRFVAGARKPLRPGWARNLSPSYRFQYQTNYAGSRKNLDSAEYANITLHFIAWYEQALRAGMRPLPDADLRVLRAWAARVQFGYWMHNGMLSWDSGLGFARWMKAKTWAYAQQGLLALASSPRFWLHPRQGAWAKYVFDRALWQFAIRCQDLEPRHLPPAHLYDVGSAYQGTGSRRAYVARMGANAMRAISLGLADMDA